MTMPSPEQLARPAVRVVLVVVVAPHEGDAARAEPPTGAVRQATQVTTVVASVNLLITESFQGEKAPTASTWRLSNGSQRAHVERQTGVDRGG
jgi:hypothetical protein